MCSKTDSLKSFIHKTVNLEKEISILGPQNIKKVFCGPPNFFQCFMVRNLKKFGKHCLRYLIVT